MAEEGEPAQRFTAMDSTAILRRMLQEDSYRLCPGPHNTNGALSPEREATAWRTRGRNEGTLHSFAGLYAVKEDELISGPPRTCVKASAFHPAQLVLIWETQGPCASPEDWCHGALSLKLDVTGHNMPVANVNFLT